MKVGIVGCGFEQFDGIVVPAPAQIAGQTAKTFERRRQGRSNIKATDRFHNGFIMGKRT
jgi:hypothetical protein